jgi:hypothetical protein
LKENESNGKETGCPDEIGFFKVEWYERCCLKNKYYTFTVTFGFVEA